MDLFSDSINEMVLGSIQREIEEDLFDQWNDSNLNEGAEYADFRFFSYADNETKKRYNEFYNYTPEDEYYLDVE